MHSCEYCAMALSTGSTTSQDTGPSRVMTVGITGGMGAGKSTVCRVIKCLGHAVYDSDFHAKTLYDRDPELLALVVQEFGQDILMSNGELNRPALADHVFGSDSALAKLNSLVHPAVRRHFDHWAKRQKCAGQDCVFREAAVLFESGAHEQCDFVCTVSAPESIRLERVMRRNGMTKADVEQRMSRQWTDHQRAERADHVIVNDGTVPLVPQVVRFMDKLESIKATFQ